METSNLLGYILKQSKVLKYEPYIIHALKFLREIQNNKKVQLFYCRAPNKAVTTKMRLPAFS
jgi:hypothetical protein